MLLHLLGGLQRSYITLPLQVLVDGREYSITARKEVIVCAGAHNSPKLLLLSGVGNSTELAEVRYS